MSFKLYGKYTEIDIAEALSSQYKDEFNEEIPLSLSEIIDTFNDYREIVKISNVEQLEKLGYLK